MYPPSDDIWMSDMDTHKTTSQQNRDGPTSNGKKDAEHQITGQDTMQRNQSKNKDQRHPSVHSRTEVEMGRTCCKIHRQQMDKEMYGLAATIGRKRKR